MSRYDCNAQHVAQENNIYEVCWTLHESQNVLKSKETKKKKKSHIQKLFNLQ